TASAQAGVSAAGLLTSTSDTGRLRGRRVWQARPLGAAVVAILGPAAHALRPEDAMTLPSSIEGVVTVELLRGAEAPPAAVPDLLVEVPHGADLRAHYDALRARLVGELPADLHCFFHINTDVGAWAYGR